jgi:hypothetical protein
MTLIELKIEAICELTGDSRFLVTEVIGLMRDLLKSINKDDDFMDAHVPDKNVAKIKNNLKADSELITWYKDGLRYYSLLKQRGNMQ